jgi:hypothetical protein
MTRNKKRSNKKNKKNMDGVDKKRWDKTQPRWQRKENTTTEKKAKDSSCSIL